MVINLKKQIVLIEQNAARAEDFKRIFMLEPEFSLEVVSTGSEGFNKAKSIQPSFVVISDTISDVDFFQLLGALSESAPYSKKAVILTVENPALQTYLMNNQRVSVVVTQSQVVERLAMLMKQALQATSQSSFQGAQLQQSGFPPSQQGVFPPAQQSGFPPSQQGVFPPAQQSGFPPSQQGGFPPVQQSGFPPSQQGGFPPVQQSGFPPSQQGGFPPAQQSGFPPSQQGGFTSQFSPNAESMQRQEMPEQQFGGQYLTDQSTARGVKTLKQLVIAVNCPKGGVGKSTISKELALAFATVKINGQPLKVCLVDCDLDFGDIASMLRLSPNITISNWIADIKQKVKSGLVGGLKYSQQQVERYLLTHKDTGLKVLAAPTSHQDDIELTNFDIETIFDNIKSCDFDIIIFDTANNVLNHTMIALEKAAIVLLITTLDVASIYDSKLLVDTLKTIEFPMNKMKLVINRMPKGENQDINIHEIAQILGIPILDVIPEYPQIRKITNNGHAAVLERETEFSVAIKRLGNHLFPVFNKAIRENANYKNKSLIGKLFSRNGKA